MNRHLIPEYEAREAARFALVPFAVFANKFDGVERAHAMAHYWAHRMMSAHADDATLVAIDNRPQPRK